LEEMTVKPTVILATEISSHILAYLQEREWKMLHDNKNSNRIKNHIDMKSNETKHGRRTSRDDMKKAR